jgi:hypothetical protein
VQAWCALKAESVRTELAYVQEIMMMVMIRNAVKVRL